MDLADAGSPEKLVSLILQHEPELKVPVPIRKLCRQLDIQDICPLDVAGFDGGLLTDSDRVSGIIMYRVGMGEGRTRFTIGHELAHFLLPTHVPDKPGRFLCSRADLALLSYKEQDRRSRMEVEANRFASLLLMPPAHLRRSIGGHEPDLHEVVRLAKEFAVSKEAMARAYVQYHSQVIAIIVVKDGKVLRIYRDAVKFPFIKPSPRSTVPAGSLFHREICDPGAATDQTSCLPTVWIDVEWGRTAPELFEQVLMQQEGFALIMLHLVKPDEDEEEEERAIEESWRARFHR
jgi:hypothetical protein